MAEETAPDAFCRQQIAIMNRVDSRHSLGSIDCPTLVLVGEQDTVTTVEHATEIAEGIPKAQLAVIRDSGHLSTVEQPAVVARTLIDWLAQITFDAT
jgi:pimeloyl-ACP methyl ester carboxylesterase